MQSFKVFLPATFACALLLCGCSTSGPLSVTDWPIDDYGRYGLTADPSSFDYGPIGVDVQADHTFMITNTGKTLATDMTGTVQGDTFSFKGGSYPGSGGSCGAALAPGASCNLIVTFSPSASVTVYSGTFTLDYKDGSNHLTASRRLTGGRSGHVPTLVVEDEEGFSVGTIFDYGPLGTGRSLDHTFHVRNTGADEISNLTGFVSASFQGTFSFKGGWFPGLGGTCDINRGLKPLEECTVVVTFSPTSPGPATTVLEVDSIVGVQFSSVLRKLQGTGTIAAVLSLRPPQGEGRLYDYGTLPIGSSSDSTFHLANIGGSRATGLSASALPAPFSFKGGSYPGQGGSCGDSLDAGKDCTLVVTFTPPAEGSSSARLAIGYADGSATQTATFSLVGAGTGRAVLAVADRIGGAADLPAFDYGTAGFPLDHIFYVTNLGAQAATSLSGGPTSAPFAFKGGSYPGQGGSCGPSLAPGATCTLVVTFTPGNGPATAFASVNYFDGAWPQTAGRVVTGTSTTQANVIIADCLGCVAAPGRTDYGLTGIPTERTFYITNVGGRGTTSLSVPTYLLDDSFSIKRSSCGFSLAPGDTCTLGVEFNPKGGGPIQSELMIEYQDGATHLSAVRTLVATGISTALLTLADWSSGDNAEGPFDYGATTTPVDHTFNVWNSGGYAVTGIGDGGTLGSGFAFKGGAFPGQGGTCGASLDRGASCTVVVTFTPGSNAPSSSTLTLTYNDGAVPLTVTRALTGATASAARLTLTELPGQGANNPNPIDYGTTGQSMDRALYVTNSGAQPATALASAPLSGGFEFKGGAFPGQGGTCGASLAPGASCTVVVTFIPGGDSLRSCIVALTYDDGASLETTTRTLTGTATTRALLTLSEFNTPGCGDACGPFSFGTWALNPSPVPTQLFYVVNTGGQAANLAASYIDSLRTPFSYVGGGYPGTGASCTGTLAAGASCTLNVQFDPTVQGTFQELLALDVSDSAGSLPEVARALSGIGQ